MTYLEKQHFIDIAKNHFATLWNTSPSEDDITLDRKSSNCMLASYNDTQAIIYVNTVVAYIDTNGDIVLDSGGRETVTTQKWINFFLPHRYNLYQKDFVRYIDDNATGKTIDFEDGMRLEALPY